MRQKEVLQRNPPKDTSEKKNNETEPITIENIVKILSSTYCREMPS